MTRTTHSRDAAVSPTGKARTGLGGHPHRQAVSPLARAGMLVAAVLVLAASVLPAPVAAQSYDTPEKLFVEVRKSLLLELGEKVETVSITDTELADFVVAAKTQVLIHGKKEGTTSLVVWTQGGAHKRYDLQVRRGYATKQILLSVRIAELIDSRISEYGIDYLARELGIDRERSAGVYSGNVGRPAMPLSAGSLPEFSDDASVALRWIKGTENYEVLLHAMQQKGILKILARPDLVCLDGEEASFLSGGEFPIPVAQTSSIGGTTITIEWRDYGVKLDFLPTIIDSTLINLKVEPEVSNLDFNNAVVVGGFAVPALQTRRAATHVELEDNESLIIGGLRATTERNITRKIPIIGDIPLLGHLFRSVDKQSDESELLIIVSPKIVTPMAEGTPLPPVPWERPASD
ncbi:MAG: pilus assembly protein N-terminal domain-containing protein [Candidatus Eiseniibacteriota bacterium]|jgi:pilus assembly protein CpaC